MKKEILIIENGRKRLYGILFTPELPAPYPLVIGCHGFDGSHVSKLDYGEYLAERGFAFYAFDFYGGGRETKSGGTMEEMSVLTEAGELEAVIRHFQSDDRFDTGRISLWGHSQGGYVATYTAGMHPDWIHSLVLLYPAYVIQDHVRAVREQYHGFPERYEQWDCILGRIYGEDALSHDIYELMEHFRGKVLIVHGDQDPMVPIEYSKRALKHFHNPTFYVMSGAGHGFEGADREKMKELAADSLMEKR